MTEGSPANDESYEQVVLPHLDAAYRLARWLLRNDQDAEDAVQEASLLRRLARTSAGGSGRAWFFRTYATRVTDGAGAPASSRH